MPCENLLDACCSEIEKGAVRAGMDRLVEGLAALRGELTRSDWEHWIRRVCLQHPLRELLHRDPLTGRSFHKPRGYAGDAVMLDMACGLHDGSPEVESLPTLSREIFRYSVYDGKAAAAVRYGNRVIAKMMDETCRQFPSPRILAIAGGHLREADLSAAFQHGLVGEYVALDPDRANLAEVERRHGARITRVHGSLRQLFSGTLPLGQFDFVYAAGLFNSLATPVARRAVKAMLLLVKPQGRILFANFAAGLPDAGYMESFMDWWLIHRSEQEMEALISQRENGLAEKQNVFSDPTGSAWYAVAQRAG
jgi:extracellular factor (EF) 3-hydroxypalmitic acid methyl ester biosynthesis protein